MATDNHAHACESRFKGNTAPEKYLYTEKVKLKDDYSSNFRIFQIKNIFVKAIMLKIACKNSYWFQSSVHTFVQSPTN